MLHHFDFEEYRTWKLSELSELEMSSSNTTLKAVFEKIFHLWTPPLSTPPFPRFDNFTKVSPVLKLESFPKLNYILQFLSFWSYILQYPVKLYSLIKFNWNKCKRGRFDIDIRQLAQEDLDSVWPLPEVINQPPLDQVSKLNIRSVANMLGKQTYTFKFVVQSNLKDIHWL